MFVAAGMLKKVIFSINVILPLKSAHLARVPTLLTAGHALFMEDKPFQILQLNAQKKPGVMHSLINDEQLKDYGVLFVSEPHAWRSSQSNIISTPTSHRNWAKVEPEARDKTGWVYRSMLWIKNDIEMEQVQAPSSDITTALIWLPHQTILLVSVYVEGNSQVALSDATATIASIIAKAKLRSDSLKLIIVGDFNRHDNLWGGDTVSDSRQGEAEPIIKMMAEFRLISLLRRGIITRSQGGD